MGFFSALELAKTGARVLVTERNPSRGQEAVQELIRDSSNSNIELVVGDVSSVSGVNALANQIAERVAKIDVLINNAGYLGSERKDSADGLEMHFAINVVAPRRLTQNLSLQLRAAERARVINVTGGNGAEACDKDDLEAEKGFKGLMTYARSKGALEAMSMVMARELESDGITVNVVFPGRASTTMSRSLGVGGLPGPMKMMLPLFKFLFREDGGRSAAKAARSTIWAATAPELEGVTGKYFDAKTKERRLHSTAYEPEVQRAVVALADSV